MKILKDENGQTLILVAVSMPVLIGFLAFAIDMGSLYRAKRNLQITADAAATAAALDYLYRGSVPSATSAAQAAATANGVTNGSGGGVVTVNSPPVNGPNASTGGFFEVIVSAPSAVTFISVITHSRTMTSPAGRSPARPVPAMPASISQTLRRPTFFIFREAAGSRRPVAASTSTRVIRTRSRSRETPAQSVRTNSIWGCPR